MNQSQTTEQIDVWRLPGLPGLELRSGVAVKTPYPRHWHDEYQFCFIADGGGELFYRGVHHDTPATSLFIVHPGEVHSNHTAIGCSFQSLYVSTELMLSLNDDEGSTLPFFSEPLVFDEQVIALYRHLHRSRQTTTLEQHSTLLEMLAHLVRRYARERWSWKAAGKEHRAVRKIREFVAENYASNISLNELATLVNLSPFHLTRAFTGEVGMPPHAFQTQMRIARAKQLLASGVASATVAVTTGFADQSHFIRQFKRLMKITPGQYSKNVQYRRNSIT